MAGLRGFTGNGERFDDLEQEAPICKNFGGVRGKQIFFNNSMADKAFKVWDYLAHKWASKLEVLVHQENQE